MNISCLYYRVYNLCVADIMKKNIFHVTYRSTYKDLKELLDQSDIRSYPLVDDKGKSCKLVSNLETEFKDVGSGIQRRPRGLHTFSCHSAVVGSISHVFFVEWTSSVLRFTDFLPVAHSARFKMKYLQVSSKFHFLLIIAFASDSRVQEK